jgi:hypothetical protein
MTWYSEPEPYEENKEGVDTFSSIIHHYYENNIFLVEDILSLTIDLEYFELSMFHTAPLSSIIYNYPPFRIEDHYTQTDMIEFYHSTSDDRYKLLQILVNGLKRKGVELHWLGSPIFFGQL